MNSDIKPNTHDIILQPLTPFQWEKVMRTLPTRKGGNQILHSNNTNKPYEKNPEAQHFVESYLQGAIQLESDAAVLNYALDSVSIKGGVYIELGVCTGRTINGIAFRRADCEIHGFDSFEGLPEDWERPDIPIKKGTFAPKDQNFVPPVLNNVSLYKGWFKDTLPRFKAQIMQDKPIAFLHIDSDIYSSACDAFQALGENIVPGTIIVFDELYNYPGYEKHEWKAFKEFLKSRCYQYKALAYNRLHEQVAVQIQKG